MMWHKIKTYCIIGACWATTAMGWAQTPPEQQWVDSVYTTLSDTQRVGQLFMIRAHSNLGQEHVDLVTGLIQRYQVGALCFFQGTAEKQAELTNMYQKMSKIPLMVAIDAEWGLNMRLKEGTIPFPKQLMLGAIQDNKLIYRFGEVVAKECRRIGVNVNFAPVADVNNNSNNPVINERSFGEDKMNVAVKAFMYMKGMQDNNVLACAKHFPGHGDTDVDSHYDLPVITHDTTRLNDVELMPFRILTQLGVGSVMVAHLQVNAIDSATNRPTSLSRNAITHVLRQRLGYNGIVITDGLEMKGVTKYFANGEASAQAIAAGNDMLCLPENVPQAFDRIMAYLKEGRIDSVQMAQSVKRILTAKYRLGLTSPQSVDLTNIRADLNSPEAVGLKRELIKNALTLVRRKASVVPLTTYTPTTIGVLSIGSEAKTAFQSAFDAYGFQHYINVGTEMSADKRRQLVSELSRKSLVIIGLHSMKARASDNFGLSKSALQLVRELSEATEVVLVVFGNPYALRYFESVPTLVCAYNEDRMTQELAAQGLLGAFEFKGKLPVTASLEAKAGMGLQSPKIDRLEWNLEAPEAVGMSSKGLLKIDEIAQELIADGAAPGCQILVAKEGQVVYHKAFGHTTYTKERPVQCQTLYDLASITKCMATTLSLMHLFEAGKWHLDDSLSRFVPILRGSNKEGLRMRDILTHQAGLKAWIPFHKETVHANATLDGFIPDSTIYRRQPDTIFCLKVADSLYMSKDYATTIKQKIADSPLDPNKTYVYSDLGMILMADAIKTMSGTSLDSFADLTFFQPLAMTHTGFNPLNQFPDSTIAPTEEDHYFRNQRLQGYVHDMTAAMLGGISGHAGLFSNTADLAAALQMLLNKGHYGTKKYFDPQTVALFTRRQEGSSRRGYGWDLKELDKDKPANMSRYASDNTFGHTGFTGNAAYVDPDNQLIYIFLSNRTYPDMNNNKLTEKGYRSRIQTAIYQAMCSKIAAY